MTESEEDSFIHTLHKYLILSLFMAHFLYLCNFLYAYPTIFPTITPQFVRKRKFILVSLEYIWPLLPARRELISPLQQDVLTPDMLVEP